MALHTNPDGTFYFKCMALGEDKKPCCDNKFVGEQGWSRGTVISQAGHRGWSVNAFRGDYCPIHTGQAGTLGVPKDLGKSPKS
ncbi:MAG: hypothetical protein ACOZAO_00750 [Patescibacteria group bacterium]